MNRLKIYIGFITLAILSAGLSGCNNKKPEIDAAVAADAAIETLPVEKLPVVEGIDPLTPAGPDYERIKDLPIPEPEPVPEYLREGIQHKVVEQLQGRLMELGFMDNDEPTNYFGTITRAAVISFQRQNELAMDGIAGQVTWDAIMNPDAKYYAVSKGVSGEDIKRIQNRLYELGYLATADLVNGEFSETTEAAVIKLQEVNGIGMDGKVGQQTVNLLYSDEIKPNMLAYGDKSEVVLAAQKRLKTLGYLTTDPDGTYGTDTAIAVKQFQSRNDLVVDGYLGPSTRVALNGGEAAPNGITLGDQGESVQQIQQLLSKFGYLSSGNVTGYYGEVTESAVKKFQSTHGLSSDGSVGIQTMAKLTGTDVKKAQSSGGGSKKKSGSGGGSQTLVSGSGASALISVASSKVGRPYVYGAKGPNSFDCSGFIYWCLNQVGVKQSYLTSSGWRNVGKYTKITSFSNLSPGDIVVVKGHVGIVASGGTVIDASSSNGRVVHRSLSGWWRNNFICGWRIFG